VLDQLPVQMPVFTQKVSSKGTILIDHCKVAVIGNVDSGKSTLVGVLTKKIPDDGRGLARTRVLNFPHEQ